MTHPRRLDAAVLSALLVVAGTTGCDLRTPAERRSSARDTGASAVVVEAPAAELPRTSSAPDPLPFDSTSSLFDQPISVYFTADAQPTVDSLAAMFIARAARTLDCAFFEIDSRRVADALIAAHHRGVRVRVVSDADYRRNPEAQAIEDAGIPIVWDERSALMHDKFMVADGEVVWTGSWNATENCTFRNDNNALALRGSELAENYAAEFEEMFVERSFGPRSPSNTPHSKTTVGGADVYNWFAPEDDVPDKVLRFVRAAKRSVHVMAFSFSDDELASLLIDKHAAGIEIGVVVERRGAMSRGAEFERLRAAGVAASTDGNRYLMHHKVIVVDGLWTITGSYNFSRAAAESNDENVLVIKSAEIASRFEAEYRRVSAVANQVAVR